MFFTILKNGIDNINFFKKKSWQKNIIIYNKANKRL
jgi:hypothetical protein